MAIDGNGLSSKIKTMNSWPAVLITAPLDQTTNNTNPYAYKVPSGKTNPIRALVFDPGTNLTVQYQVDAFPPLMMNRLYENENVWQGSWDASGLPAGPHTIRVDAKNSAGAVSSDTISVEIEGSAPAETSGATIQPVSSSYKRGSTVEFLVTVADSGGPAIEGATVTIDISGPSSAQIASGTTNESGQALARWTTTVPVRKGPAGTPLGTYTARVAGVASSHPWDGIQNSATFSIVK